MGNMALWFIGIMLGIIVVHLIHIKMYLRDIHSGLEYACIKLGQAHGSDVCAGEYEDVQ